MVTAPTVPENKNDVAGEDQQQFPGLGYKADATKYITEWNSKYLNEGTRLISSA
jgi:hypothetical protein